uniref:Polysaccharide biosynthesis domain-containing protein n=1 Tax=Papio anubis TaxID=9555 RepID=A0A8I5NY32_PAPAN
MAATSGTDEPVSGELVSVAHALSLPAESYGNDLISSVDPQFLKLTKVDDQIYSEFRKNFETLRIDVLDPEELKSESAKEPPGYNSLPLKLLGTGKAITKLFISVFRTKKERKESTMEEKKELTMEKKRTPRIEERKELIVEKKKRKESTEKTKLTKEEKKRKKLTKKSTKVVKKLCKVCCSLLEVHSRLLSAWISPAEAAEQHRLLPLPSSGSFIPEGTRQMPAGALLYEVSINPCWEVSPSQDAKGSGTHLRRQSVS